MIVWYLLVNGGDFIEPVGNVLLKIVVIGDTTLPSDYESIAQCVCTGCGRSSDKVALKRLNTYSRAFGCLTCYERYKNCANCNHEKHKSLRSIIARGDDYGSWGRCLTCGCTEYRHGLEEEFDRQFAEHTGKAPRQRKCLRCGNHFEGKTMWCARCDREWRELNG